ncbi:MAG: sigma-70 family RNA polymerase sigma factor [Candidatus Hydrogenedentes bacterium]|nr:sigma-70 family RNA polymerase sigma factor [Candidatus Hydrogenedentota bacterium]
MDEARHKLAEQLLLIRCQAGDEFAFTRLVSTFDSRLRYFVRRIIDSPSEADDLMQNIWLTVWRQLPKLRRLESFRPWLYRIARNAALQTLRGRRQELPLEPDVPLTAQPEAELDVLSAQAIHAALDKISVLHKEVLVLRFLEDMSYEAIAEVVGCTVGTVRSRIYYGKEALRREMETAT